MFDKHEAEQRAHAQHRAEAAPIAARPARGREAW
jgi:hypothetical protein